MPLVPIPACQKKWNFVFTGTESEVGPADRLINNNVICADSTLSDTCQGDSGGPLLNTKAGALIGITSLGIDCASGIPGVYTRISAYQEWITSVTQL
jgi:secreted trypsin-like serine protease